MSGQNLLVELFVEELPPKALKILGESFANGIFNWLEKSHLVLRSEIVNTRQYASPRRLAVLIPEVLSKADDKQMPQKLMPVSVGLDASGQATPALLKKLAAFGVGAEVVPKLRREGEGKAESLFYDSMQPGPTLTEGLQLALRETLTKLPIPKVMTYQLADGWSSVQFVRPAHRLVALHGAEVVPVSVLGLQAGRTTQGHRFEAAASTLDVRDSDSYEAQMEKEGAVIPNFEKRRAEIVRQLAAAASKVGGGVKPIEDDALLDEVTGLVERPNVLLCQFDAQFLEVPQECLILTMKANQKYFPLLDANGKLTNKFLVVSNINPADVSAVIGGNERVVRPRLADAKFFYDQDRKKTLESRVRGLEKVVYHNKLGVANDMFSRTVRVREGARVIGEWLGGESLGRQARLAALLAKADLLTDMVGEFPELQGIMGRYYAQYDDHGDDIAFAVEDHYKPRFAGDDLPRNQVGIVVALADKFETLVGMFGIGEKPTGDKDPFGLRRQALGAIRILTECNISLALDDLINNAQTMLENPNFSRRAAQDLVGKTLGQSEGGVKITGMRIETLTPIFVDRWFEDLQQFIFDRFAGLLREQGYSAQEIEAVLSLRPRFLNEVPKRLAAVRAFAALPEAAALAAANKRVSNILKKSEAVPSGEIDANLLHEQAEQDFLRVLQSIAKKANDTFDAGDYTGHLQSLAVLKEPVDRFFDQVMVNAEDADLRMNRLRLLAALHASMNRVADISKLAA